VVVGAVELAAPSLEEDGDEDEVLVGFADAEEVEPAASVGDDVAPVPGCSFATTTPTRAVAPVAATMAALVMRRRRTWARSRDSGDGGSLGRIMLGDLGVGNTGYTTMDESAQPQDHL